MIAEFAASQEGVVGRAQLLAAGLARGAIQRRLESRILALLYPAVYAYGAGPLSMRGEAFAAVLACGNGALLSHRSPLELLGVIDRADGNAWHVTVLNRKPWGPNPGAALRRGLRPIRVHFTSVLFDGEVSPVCGVPSTSVERSLIDFARHAPRHELSQAYDELLIAELSSRERLAGTADLHVRRPGVSRIRRLLGRDAPPSVTLSHAERVLVELLRGAGLNGFATNVRVGPYRVDVLWRAERVIVEVDGAAFHSGDARRERDTRRDAELAARGFVVLRVTWRELRDHSQRAVARIARTLAMRAP